MFVDLWDLHFKSRSTEQALKGCSDLMFLELLFWKNAREAESLRNNYQWKVRRCSMSHRYARRLLLCREPAHEAG